MDDAGARSANQPTAAVPDVSLWHGDRLIARSIRFALTVLGPIAAGLIIGLSGWLIYAMVTSILAFSLDPGGRAFSRLGWMALGGLVVIAGAGLGTLAAGHHVLVMLGFAGVGVLYALVESIHPSAAMAARFLCFTLAIGALYLPLAPLDVAVIAAALLYAWLVSLAWDLALGGARPSTAPHLPEVSAALRATSRERRPFAAAVAIAVPLAYLAAVLLGLHRPYWTLIVIVVVLRADAMSSQRLMVEMLLGTLLGIGAALLYGLAFPGHWALLVGMLVAALVRWPAQHLHGALGTAALTAFVMLLLELVAGSVGQAAQDMEARLVDVAVGCAFALVALLLDRLFQRLMTTARGPV